VIIACGTPPAVIMFLELANVLFYRVATAAALFTNGLFAFTLGVQSDNQSYFFHVR